MTAYEKPLPTITKLNSPYLEGTRRGELRLQQCTRCSHLRFPPSSHCPCCLSRESTWIRASGHGEVWSFVVFHQKYFRAFAGDLPYNCALIRLEEGPLMMSAVVGVAAAEIRCGLPVEVVFEEATEAMSIPKFRPRPAKNG